MNDFLFALKLMSGFASTYLLIGALRAQMERGARRTAEHSTIEYEDDDDERRQVYDLLRLAVMGQTRRPQRATEIAGYDYQSIV